VAYAILETSVDCGNQEHASGYSWASLCVARQEEIDRESAAGEDGESIAFTA
jgi:hypothetical protein